MQKMKLNEVKEILINIVLEETQLLNPEMKASPMKKKEFYQSEYFKNILKSRNIRDIFFGLSIPFRYGGMCQKDEIMIFFEDYVKLQNLGIVTCFPDLLALTYHEVRHTQQEYKIALKELSLESFIYYIEDLLGQNETFYIHEHNNFFFELDANLYGITKAEKYIKNNFLKSPRIEKYLEKRKKKCEYQYNNYNFQFFFSKFCVYLKQSPSKDVFNDPRIAFFFHKDGSFKSINELLNSPLELVEDNLLYAIIASDVYLQELSLSSLSEEENEIVNNALKYREHIEEYKLQHNNNYYEYKKQVDKSHLDKVQKYIEMVEENKKQNHHNFG